MLRTDFPARVLPRRLRQQYPFVSPERRTRMRRLASTAVGLLSATLAAAPALAGPATPVLSGLTWRSGSTAGGFPCLAQLRSRQLDASHVFLIDDDFPSMVAQSAGWLQ